ncbi:MAG: aminopeptidase [Gammaproteobacteria bacterium]|nr:aminopeptidase [Gammaproteobacteria bacterium]
MLYRFLWLGTALLLAGCGSVGYYAQSVRGQLAIWHQARPISDWLAEPATDNALRNQLELAVRLRAFASEKLALPDNDSYTLYADLKRRYVAWNVFAATEFSVEPVTWCYPVIGCAAYRGYFSEAAAREFAESLRGQGKDVFVGGVPAYSTLGWFDDPLLNTVIHYPDAELAALIFHELTHQVVYVKGDTAFNESFATAVELEGTRRWFAAAEQPQLALAHRTVQQRERVVVELILKFREQLEELYQSGLAVDQMRARKASLFDALRRAYADTKAGWPGYRAFDAWFARDLNNAHLVALGAYHRHVPAFEALLRAAGGDLPEFYARVKELAELDPGERETRLAGLAAR